MRDVLVVVKYYDDEKYEVVEERIEVLQEGTVTEQLVDVVTKVITDHPLMLIHMYIGATPPEDAFAPEGATPGP